MSARKSVPKAESAQRCDYWELPDGDHCESMRTEHYRERNLYLCPTHMALQIKADYENVEERYCPLV